MKSVMRADVVSHRDRLKSVDILNPVLIHCLYYTTEVMPLPAYKEDYLCGQFVVKKRAAVYYYHGYLKK